MNKIIPFSPPRVDQQMIDEVVDTLRSGWITTGPKTKAFERKLAEYCDVLSVICLNSATAGLELMLRWFDVKEGDEVILPAYTYAATANVVMHCGAKPVLADIGEDFNIDVSLIKSLISSKTKVIMPVDFGGWPCHYNELNRLVSETKGLFVPESSTQKALGRIMLLADAAHSLGAVYNKRKTGTVADATVFSFHAVKNLTTAEGGAIVLNFPAPFKNEEIYRFLNILSLHGQNKDALAKLQKGNWKYDVITAGYKCNMTDMMASLGLVELSRYDTDTLTKRKHICNRYAAALKKKQWAELPIQKNNEKESSYHLFALRIKGIDESTRDKIIESIFEKNVSVNVHFIPLPLLTFYKNKGFRITDYPKAYQFFSCEISLPVFYDLTDEMIDTVLDAVISSVEQHI
ncbi:MAG: DegT/DnrJ/EryC1/StrS family aminotransferase [Bacteroidia bacterium]|nr:DegT/DnrJ/EryC1/StrS family aminotransferase [Bacteroidia bacterium]MCZ2276957.1 DegT/DnrJ/EryC1/StrS family aminotransferase [Bacteroidia bacterium]